MTDTASNPDLIQPVAELFIGGASALWATTYNVDLALFNEFLLPRLGEPPLNIVVLADHHRLTASLERIPPERTDTLAAVNRRWLLRSVCPPGGVFHPKSYLTVTGGSATLLIGSGNLSAGGLDDGREVFTKFRSGTPIGDSAIASWRQWMRHLVALVDDINLAERFRDLEDHLPVAPSVTPTVISPLLHNLTTPIAAQLVTAISEHGAGGIDELLLAAPFYDVDNQAVEYLLTNLAPRRVQVFVTGATSVNGHRLAKHIVASGAELDVAAYEPDRFVHAKLIGVIAGDHGWLLSGSANLSRNALTRTINDDGNVELAVLAPLGVEDVRAAFFPPGMDTARCTLDGLTALTFRSKPEPQPPAVRLLTAAELPDGRIEIVSQPPANPGWLLDDLVNRQPLTIEASGRAVTAEPLAGRLVQLTDAEGQTLSNRVVVDDPATLAAVLTAGSTRPGLDRPPELTENDLATQLGRALLWLHRNLVMDVSQRISTAPTGGVAAGEADHQADEDLWERLEREQLARDPRVGTYRRMWNREESGGSEPIIELLEVLRARAPSEATGHAVRSPLARLLDHQDDSSADLDANAQGRRWEPSSRVRVRTRNILRRWADAQTDPRLTWVNPMAPAGNFAAITVFFADLYLDSAHNPEQSGLTDDDLDELWLRWLRRFAGTGKSDGWLDQLDPADLALAHQRLPPWLPEVTAALCCLALPPGPDHREQIVALQPILTAALNHGLINPTDTTADYLGSITGQTITCGEIDDHVLEILSFIDDPLWCARTANELGLDDLTLQAPPGTSTIQVRLGLRGIDDPLLDPRIPRLIVEARNYRRCDGVALFATDKDWRLVVANGQTIAYLSRRGGDALESTVRATTSLLQELIASGNVLANLFPRDRQPDRAGLS